MLPDTWSVLIDGSGSVVLAEAEGQVMAQGSSGTEVLALQGPCAPWSPRLGQGRRRGGHPATPCP